MLTLLITDANILIDLAEVDRCELLFLDGYEVVVAVDVYYEIRQDQMRRWEPFVGDGRLRLHEPEEERVERIRPLARPKLSEADLTFAATLEELGGIALTGDRNLVRTCRSLGFECHGILWLLDQWEASDDVAAPELYRTLEDILRTNTRLPIQECMDRLSKWRNDRNPNV
jgi:hypothetical protein